MSVDLRARPRAPLANPKAREFLRKADPVLGRVIDAHPGFRPRAWMDDLPQVDAFGTLIFQVVGQQRLYGFDHVPTENELIELSGRWRPYRSLAVSYLFASEYDG